MLPHTLHSMPQWDARKRSAECMVSSDSQKQAQCLQSAREDLASKVQSLYKTESV
jgi:hypothetical protein